ncbi:unnamed protein product [Paramecium octaurelia]|uniref:Uncharacterized protein n=1 Tax=Paramecium octaurelia TaxID=43137 RepID=A0A8S1WHC1_PAROT|nr:unnamed protein product [Paramecium octaurelia]
MTYHLISNLKIELQAKLGNRLMDYQLRRVNLNNIKALVLKIKKMTHRAIKTLIEFHFIDLIYLQREEDINELLNIIIFNTLYCFIIQQ